MVSQCIIGIARFASQRIPFFDFIFIFIDSSLINQGWQCAPEKATAWNLLSLFTECGMLSLEISIVAFLLQENYASGLEALAHTFLVSGSFVAVDMLIQVMNVSLSL